MSRVEWFYSWFRWNKKLYVDVLLWKGFRLFTHLTILAKLKSLKQKIAHHSFNSHPLLISVYLQTLARLCPKGLLQIDNSHSCDIYCRWFVVNFSKWSANKNKVFIKRFRRRNVGFPMIRSEMGIMGKHLTRLVWKCLEDSTQFLSWNKGPLNVELKLFIVLCWKFCTHWWSLVPSTILRLESACYLSSRKQLWQAWEKGNMRTRIGQVFRKPKWSQFFIVHCTKTKNFAFAGPNTRRIEERITEEVRFNCW